MDQFKSHVLGFASLSLALLVALPARGASLQKVNQSEWGADGLPSYVNMYIYVPDKLAAKPPIVVAPHHCQGNGQGTFSEMSSLVSIANTSGFIMIFPEATGQNCWDAGSTRSLNHGGGGDTGAIVQMVKYTLAKYSGDAGRVYSVGGSSGGIMTEALLGVYPDVFMAGVSLMGVPCGCWAEGYNDVTGTGSSAQWSGPCGGGNVTKTGQQWGDLVRSYYPGYTGHRPRLQHWHGTADTILSYKNMAEDVKEWTNLLGLSETPSGTDTPKRGTTRQSWKSSCGYTVYEAFSMDGVGHAVPFDGPAVAAYFGLDRAGGQDPETAACPGAVPGGSDTEGAGGAAGAGGAGGEPGAGGAGGEAATGGAGGEPGAGGAGGGAATGGTGGVMGSGSGGSAGSGGAMDTASGGANGQDASSGTGDSTEGEGSSSGCSCAVGSDASDSGAQAGLLLAALGLLLGRPKRRPR
ncbi:MYXO-CTERM-sorted multifunctional esterase [Sorangium sp. So ce367]|uniref:extracellular catalytic domain type 1 short-chain-length polyhydroxyalkanoate depolymerase n=1 Tax=Sorangium sp. So ce367 TaxID=3133305 RepID=UPI003F5ED916